MELRNFTMRWQNLCCTIVCAPSKSHKSSNFNFKPIKLVAMRTPILLLAISAALFTSCTSAYKTGQTPDDVYFSPDRPKEEYVRTNNNNDERNYQGSDDYYDDRYLRMKVRNRVVWSDLDEWYFYNRRYSYSYYNNWNWNNPWSPNTYWNHYYNPYCSRSVVVNPKSNITYNSPRVVNLNTYNNNQISNRNYTTSKGNVLNNNSNNSNRPVRFNNNNSNNNNNSSSNAGNFLRNVFNNSGNNNSSSNNSSTPSSNNNSSSSSSGSSGSSSGSSAPVRKF
jgi:hypothetical protein